YVSVIEFGQEPQGRSLLVFGESADPASPHYLDQARLYAAGEMKPSWFTLEEIKKHTERSYNPGDFRRKVNYRSVYLEAIFSFNQSILFGAQKSSRVF